MRDGKLTVRWDRLGATHAQRLALDTERFEIRGDDRGMQGNWGDVDVDRDRGAATFDFSMPDTGERGVVTCRKR